MADTPPPSSRRLGKAAIWLIGIVVAVAVIVFAGMNLWHGQELEQDQATGENLATEHTPPNFERDR